MAARYVQVDVFARGSLSGNGLVVVLDGEGWSAETMQRVTQEMRQFESIFLSSVSGRGAVARVFTVEEELDFAGHPVLGAAAVLHRELDPQAPTREWLLELPVGPIKVRTEMRAPAVLAEMDQGLPRFGERLAAVQGAGVLEALGLNGTDLDARLPLQVVSTGLAYLMVPVAGPALARAAIRGHDFEARLAALGAKFVLVIDASAAEIRTWDNFGRVEDVATGSAAGPAVAYLARHLRVATPLKLAQGRFAGRPSELVVRIDERGHVHVSGEVWPVARGSFEFTRSST